MPARVLWRIVYRAALSCLLLLIVDIAVGQYARHRFMLKVEELRNSGQAVLLEDFNRPAATNEQNPVPQWRAAAEALAGEDMDEGPPFTVFEMKLPLSSADYRRLKAIVDANGPALAHAKSAAEAHGRADWNIPLVSR